MRYVNGKIVANTIDDVLLRLVICEPATLETGCWEWPMALNRGHGAVNMNKKQYKVHRVVYEHFCGPVPVGLECDHLCRNRKCANFEHIEPVTHRENSRRGIQAQRMKTHCKYGHPYDEENTYRMKHRTGRGCRACARAYQIKLRARRKEEGSG